jgi:hypothetical protein
MSELWVTDASFEDLRRVLESMIAAKEKWFPELHSIGFSGETVLRAIRETPDEYRETVFYLVPQKGESTRIEIVNDPETTAEPLAWRVIRRELDRVGYDVLEKTGSGKTVYIKHRYQNPETITNPNHRLAVEALITAESSKKRFKLKDIAPAVNYSEERLSEIRKMYLRAGEPENSEPFE